MTRWQRRLLIALILLLVVGVGVLIGLWLPFPDSAFLSFAVGLVVAGPLIAVLLRSQP